MKVDKDNIRRIVTELLTAIGEDVNRPGLLDTPRRVADMWSEFIDYDAGKTETAFESITADQLVMVSGMVVWSLCEHHMLPFYCNVSIAYIPESKVLGLSKFARIANKHAHKLQIQERLVEDIAKEVMEVTGSKNVAVLAQGEHLCMTMRGARTPAIMTSSSMNGVFRDEPEARAEFLSLIKR